MHRVTREIHFCYGHRLLNYDGKCRFLHGHNGRALITMESDHLDERGMVIDFSDIKRAMQVWIDEQLDHKSLEKLWCARLHTFQQLISQGVTESEIRRFQ